MQRFFGRKKPEVKGPSLDEASSKVNNSLWPLNFLSTSNHNHFQLDERVGSMDQKVKKIDAEIRPLQEQRKKMKPGPAKARIEVRFNFILKMCNFFDI